jgi:hypothetical protein
MVGRFAERMREGVLAASVPIGLEVLDELMQSEVVELAGPKVKHKPQTDAAPEQRPNYRRQLCVSIETGPPARSHCDADGGWEQEEAAATTDGEGRADASAGACGSSHVGGDDVGGVAVERSAGTVVAAGLPWVGMPCVVLHIPETAPGVQGCGDRGVAQRVW